MVDPACRFNVARYNFDLSTGRFIQKNGRTAEGRRVYRYVLAQPAAPEVHP